MGFIIAVLVALLVVPLLFILLGRRSAGRGGITTRSRGMTVSEPSSDQPTPGAGGNRVTQGAERRIPPG
jgi:hypothetical protein